MGWFWTDNPGKASTPITAPHPIPKPGATPPPECPMHKSDQPSPLQEILKSKPAPDSSTSSCPVKSPTQASRYPTNTTDPIASPQSQPQTQSWSATLNPLNYMPTFANERPTASTQSIALPLDREISSIPRGDSDSNWEYPSPQQMYNAMLRKGHTDTPAEDVEAMVAVHNFLNEGAWNEIVEWEQIFADGLKDGYKKCRNGEQGLALDRARREFLAERRAQAGLKDTSQESQPKLLRFQGRPNEPTPKARVLQALAKAFPERFGQDPPFDRHDWYVARKQPDGSIREVRYVIDYYGGGLQATGEPVFYLDIRPALDTPTAAAERFIRWGGDVWFTATGSGIRDQIKAQEAANKSKMRS